MDKSKEIFRHPLIIIFSFFVFLFLFSKFGPHIQISILSQEKGQPFIVTGEGKLTAVPDIATISIGIQNSSASLTAAESEVNTKSKVIFEAVKKLGVAETDIATTSYNVYPQYDYNSTPQKITGYQVSTEYLVKVRDFTKINDVISLSTQSGATSVGGVSFEVGDDTKNKLLDQARIKAVEAAKQKAQGLAKAAGVTLGKIINVSEADNSAPGPIQFMAKSADIGLGGTPTQPNIIPGQTDISVTVSLSYEIR